MVNFMRSIMVLLVVVVTGCAQMQSQIPANEAAFRFSGTVPVPGVSKSELYNRAMVYMAKAYVSAGDVIQYSSIEHGRIVGRAIASVVISDGIISMPRDYSHSIDIEVVDGKFRYTYDDFQWGLRAKTINELVALSAKASEMSVALKNAMVNPPPALVP